MCLAQICVSAQLSTPTASIPIKPDYKLDAELYDHEWKDDTENEIEQNYFTDTPTATAYWKGAWNCDGLLIMVFVDDDIWHPSWANSVGWSYDKIELYFDFTSTRANGKGAKDFHGKYQIAPSFMENSSGVEYYSMHTNVDTEHADTIRFYYAEQYDGSGRYSMEYLIPYDEIRDENGQVVPLNDTMQFGFDVTVIDVDDDEGPYRKVWANIGMKAESWNNMDDIGTVSLSGEITCEEKVSIEKLTSKDAFKIYPNPATHSDNITVQTKGMHNLTVYSVDGIILEKITVFGTDEHTLDISNYKAGTYFIHLENKQEINTQQLLIQP